MQMETVKTFSYAPSQRPKIPRQIVTDVHMDASPTIREREQPLQHKTSRSFVDSLSLSLFLGTLIPLRALLSFMPSLGHVICELKRPMEDKLVLKQLLSLIAGFSRRVKIEFIDSYQTAVICSKSRVLRAEAGRLREQMDASDAHGQHLPS